MLKNKNTIGINIMGHDASISYFDGNDIFAIDEERLTRFKHDGTSIKKSVDCLSKYHSIDKNNLMYSLCYENEIFFSNPKFVLKKKIEKKVRKIFNLSEIKEQKKILGHGKFNLLLKLFAKIPFSLGIFGMILEYLISKSRKKEFKVTIKEYLSDDLKDNKIDIANINFSDHHTTHCISSYFFSPFKKCLSISLDLVGDKHFSKVFLCEGEKIKELASSKIILNSRNEVISIGRIYVFFTAFLGFTPNSDEGKVEALAAYGSTKNNKLYDYLIKSTSISENNQMIIEKDVIDYLEKNISNIEIEIGKENIAAAIQGYLENTVLSYVKKLINQYQIYDICLSGGNFANVKLNMRLYEESGLQNLYIIPAMTDSGAGLGALILSLKKEKKIKFDTFKVSKFEMPYWGPHYSNDEIKKILKKFEDKIKIEDAPNDLWHEYFAKLITEGKIGGLFQGRMEFGPRALGNRSIIGDARSLKTKERINSVVKGRPNFQPFCPSILEEDREKLFEQSYKNKHMTCAFKMKKEFAKILPSAVHIDDTARPQFVEENDNENYYKVLKEIKKITGYGVVVNTSFNKHGRTMVMKPEDALSDFLDSKLDFVCFQGIFVFKKDN